jgi:hypothetical protein
MPEPKKPKRSYEAQARSPLEGLRLEPQRPARPARADNDSAPEESQAAGQDSAPPQELVHKLIRFIESI